MTSNDELSTNNDELSAFWAVWTKPRSSDKGTRRPVRKTYDNPLAAAEVALESARAKPGQKFFVFQVMGRFQADQDGAVNVTLAETLGLGLTPEQV